MKHGIIDCASFSGAVRTVTSSNTSVTVRDFFLVCDVQASGSSITIQLPPASENEGRVLVIKRLNGPRGRRVFLNLSGSDRIDGRTFFNFRNDYASVNIFSDGLSNWYIF